MRMRPWLEALRIRQWHKNLLVFVALIFSFRVHETDLVLRTLVLFAAFCLASSATYLLNDLRDREIDRAHPMKRNRPIAVGKIQPAHARVGAVALILLSIATSWFVLPQAIIAYLALSSAYTVFFRHIVIADVIVIALGFIIRAVAGALAIDVPFSEWLLVCTFFGAVRLGIGKRQSELTVARTGLRDEWEKIPDTELKIIGAMTSGILIVAYTLYSFGSATAAIVGPLPLLLSLPFVYYGVVRYEFVAAKGDARDPENLLFRDRPLAIATLGWLAVSFAALYLWRA